MSHSMKTMISLLKTETRTTVVALGCLVLFAGCSFAPKYAKPSVQTPVAFKELTPEQFKALILRDCFYCGVEPLQTIKFPYETLFYNGIDRVDSNLGYVPENCVPCCKFCNYAKHNRSKEDFLTWLRRAYEHNYGKNN